MQHQQQHQQHQLEKKKKKKKKKKMKEDSPAARSPVAAAAAAAAGNGVAANRKNRDDVKPTPFLGDAAGRRWLAPEHEPSFSEVLATSYTGFVHEPKCKLPSAFHDLFERCFARLDAQGYFQYDTVLPAGFAAQTYVKRTLVGDPGITYKYLGLRLFAHPWSGEGQGAGGVMADMGRLNEALVRRSSKLLAARTAPALAARNSGGEVEQPGSCRFNLTLVNRMDPRHLKADLKPEGLFGMGKCSVSWHCDSGLENFSTIAVYHCTDADPASRIAGAVAGLGVAKQRPHLREKSAPKGHAGKSASKPDSDSGAIAPPAANAARGPSCFALPWLWPCAAECAFVLSFRVCWFACC